MKPVTFHGRSLKLIKKFPIEAKREAGHQLDRLQHGLEALDWKPVPTIGKGVREIRIRYRGQYRVIYLADRKTEIHVLHAFHKKSQKTAKTDIEIARRNFKLLDR
jgi:phage-related protein